MNKQITMLTLIGLSAILTTKAIGTETSLAERQLPPGLESKVNMLTKEILPILAKSSPKVKFLTLKKLLLLSCWEILGKSSTDNAQNLNLRVNLTASRSSKATTLGENQPNSNQNIAFDPQIPPNENLEQRQRRAWWEGFGDSFFGELYKSHVEDRYTQWYKAHYFDTPHYYNCHIQYDNGLRYILSEGLPFEYKPYYTRLKIPYDPFYGPSDYAYSQHGL